MSKVWLITGSARGLGRTILDTILKSGDRVVATARNPERLSELAARHGEQMRTFPLDVTDARASQAAVDHAVQAFGRLDVLVNNAGYGYIAPFEQTSEADFRAQIETNLFGVVNLVRAALPLMRKQRGGHIINISSVGGRTGAPGLSAYQAAKWAVGGFTEVLAREAASFGVKVIAVEPGGMRTDWGINASQSRVDLLYDYQPSVGAMLDQVKGYFGNEIGDPLKIADVIVDLAGRDQLPPHLLLGSDAVQVYAKAERERQRAADEWSTVSRSVDVDGIDLDFLERI